VPARCSVHRNERVEVEAVLGSAPYALTIALRTLAHTNADAWQAAVREVAEQAGDKLATAASSPPSQKS
jgi:hypothetical protein